jgi:hypothetical protein
MSLSIAIMQPTYLSWAGYFSLISAVDVFVFLDSVQFEHRSWQQRNRIKTQNGSLWLTVPVLKRGLRNQNINEVQIDQNSRYQKKHLNSIHQNYTHSNHYEEMYELIKDIIEYDHNSLADLNIALIKIISEKLSIKTRFLRSSALDVSGTKADLLSKICKELNGDIYITPPGSVNYLVDDNSFSNLGIKINVIEYQSPVYKQQFGEFMGQLSIIDMIFNCGFSKSAEFIKFYQLKELENYEKNSYFTS